MTKIIKNSSKNGTKNNKRKSYNHYFNCNEEKINEINFSNLVNLKKKFFWGEDNYFIQLKTKQEILEDNQQTWFQNPLTERMYGIKNLYTIIYKEYPTVQSVCNLIKKKILKMGDDFNILFEYDTKFYLLKADLTYKIFQKKKDLALFIKNILWQHNMYFIKHQQKAADENDFTFYPTDVINIGTSKFLEEITSFFLSTLPILNLGQFKKIMKWNEGKLIYNNYVVNLITNKTISLDKIKKPSGLTKTWLRYPDIDLTKVEFLIKNLILTVGRKNVDRFLYLILLGFEGEIKERKLMAVISGIKNSGSSVICNSLRAGFNDCISIKASNDALFVNPFSKNMESTRQFASFRETFSHWLVVSDYSTEKLNTNAVRQLSGGDSFEARSLHKEAVSIPYFFPSLIFNGNHILNCDEFEYQSLFVTFLKKRTILPSPERISALKTLGFPKKMIRLQNQKTVKKLTDPKIASQWIHVLKIFKENKTVFGCNFQNVDHSEVKFPALQNEKKDKIYWAFKDAQVVMADIIEKHFCITNHPQDLIEAEILNEIYAHYSFCPNIPTQETWKNFLKENYNLDEFIFGPCAPNKGSETHKEPFKNFTRFTRIFKKVGKNKKKCLFIRGLRVMNEENGFQDSSFHSESFPLENELEYKKKKKIYLKNRKNKIKIFNDQYTYIPKILNS